MGLAESGMGLGGGGLGALTSMQGLADKVKSNSLWPHDMCKGKRLKLKNFLV